MKKVNLIASAKGGVGKSFLTFLIAYNNKENENVGFIDVDSKNKSSEKRLSFLPVGFVSSYSLENVNKDTKRDMFFELLRNLTKSIQKDTFYLDMGADESSLKKQTNTTEGSKV